MEQPKRWDQFWSRLPLYYRLLFGIIVLFGMIGNCMGRSDQAVVVMLLAATCWTILRIIEEALDALRILREPPDQDKDDPPPPLAPAT
jgi:hypothetical protein